MLVRIRVVRGFVGCIRLGRFSVGELAVQGIDCSGERVREVSISVVMDEKEIYVRGGKEKDCRCPWTG